MLCNVPFLNYSLQRGSQQTQNQYKIICGKVGGDIIESR